MSKIENKKLLEDCGNLVTEWFMDLNNIINSHSEKLNSELFEQLRNFNYEFNCVHFHDKDLKRIIRHEEINILSLKSVKSQFMISPFAPHERKINFLLKFEGFSEFAQRPLYLDIPLEKIEEILPRIKEALNE